MEVQPPPVADHSQRILGKKKGNVDTDIVFDAMRKLIDNNEEFDKILLVSGDGDYYKLVKYLIEHKMFIKILFPNNNYSSLYFKIDNKYKLNLQKLRSKIERKS